MCLAGIGIYAVPFSSELPQKFRGKASPPGKLAAKQTDRAEMESGGQRPPDGQAPPGGAVAEGG